MGNAGWIGLRGAPVSVLLMMVGCHAQSSIESGPPHAANEPLAGRTQVVTVVTEDWESFRATLRRYEKVAEGWRLVGAPIDAVIGRAGYGWGRGLHGDGAPNGRMGPNKREGDGKSPAGVFAIGDAYGYAGVRPEVSLSYSQATATLRCVDDPRSAHYNRIVSTNETDVDWESAEHMRRDDDLYVLTVVVEHNTGEPEPWAGSCIFLHLWNGPDVGMSGCTAIPMASLEELAEWLKPGEAALVALPASEYEALTESWHLPREKLH